MIDFTQVAPKDEITSREFAKTIIETDILSNKLSKVSGRNKNNV